MAIGENWKQPSEAGLQYRNDLYELLASVRNIEREALEDEDKNSWDNVRSIQDVLHLTIKALRQTSKPQEADALAEVQTQLTQSPSFGGLGIQPSTTPSPSQYTDILLLTEAWLESVTSQQRSRNYLTAAPSPLPGVAPMTLAQKILTQHALSGISASQPSLRAGDVIRAGIDWVLASELSWHGMAAAQAALGDDDDDDPGIFRNDRFWLAGDHVVHPQLLQQQPQPPARIQAYARAAEHARRRFRMTAFQGHNYTIMHTEFVRTRAQPGTLVLGADSHTCSAGAVGCLSIGLGGADVLLALTLGETWMKVPESVAVDLVGQPGFGISGKDVILHILRRLKRNTVAAERIVEFGGEGARHLSVDARFAICNMCAELGAVTGVFVPYAVTLAYVRRRKRRADREGSLFFRPDAGAVYAARRTVDLAEVEPTVAVYPEPDNVVPVSEMAGTALDGVFIGACTTTEEELVLAGLVLKAGLEKGLPMVKGKRHYVPGSLPIVEKLRELGLLEVYEAAGFTRGPPGCSLCVGLSVEKASEGETWLSSQNRNFRNRMGPGSFGHITSAIVCAASSFDMTITNPSELLKTIDVAFYNSYKSSEDLDDTTVQYVEPRACTDGPSSPPAAASAKHPTSNPEKPPPAPLIESRVVTLGDFIDTDALSPGFTLTSCETDAEFGQHVLSQTHPAFRGKVAGGQRVVVAGRAFGVGSSRETAVSALKGAGVQAVIARSFAFIYGRNQPSLGLLGIVMEDEEFYELATEDAEISIDVPKRAIAVGGRRFSFQLSEIEYQLTMNRGVTQAYRRYGKLVWEKLSEAQAPERERAAETHSHPTDARLEW